jgi:molybdenum cofactor cytidylyltransferase
MAGGGGKTGYHAILLASGAGQRFGGGKLSALYRGKPLLTHAFAKARAAPVDQVIVVLGAEAASLRPLLAVDGEMPVRCTEITDWALGMSASLKAGISSLPDDAKGAFIFLGDMPGVPVEFCPALIAALEAGALAALPEHQGKPGHPVLLAATLFADVLTLQGDKGAGAILAGLGDQVTRVPGPIGAVFDIDRRDDLS